METSAIDAFLSTTEDLRRYARLPRTLVHCLRLHGHFPMDSLEIRSVPWCLVGDVGEDGGLLRTRFTSAHLPRPRLRQAIWDLPPLRPGTALLQPAVPPTSLSATAAPRQPSPSTSLEGRLDHRDRQREYRRRRTNVRVTDQGSLRSSFRCRILPQVTTPTPARHQSRPRVFSGWLRCIVCGRRGRFIDPYS